MKQRGDLMPVNISEGSLFRLALVTWLVCFFLGGLFMFPFGFVAMAILGIPIALLVSFIYVKMMDLAYGPKEPREKGVRRDEDGGRELTLFHPRDED